MAYTFSVHSVKDSLDLRSLRAAIVTTIGGMRRAEESLKSITLAALFRRDRQRDAEQIDAEPAREGIEATSPVEMEFIVTDSEGHHEGHHQAVYARYRVTRAREQGLKAVADALGLGAEAEMAIAETQGPAGGRPTLVSFPARRRRA